MDFFARQEQARRKSLFLFLYYLAAIALIVVFFNFLALALTGGSEHASPARFQIVSGVVLGAIFLGSLRRYLQLRDGGTAVAELLEAREIGPTTEDAAERRLRNVTEEMAIASGTPLPRLYILDRENGINAFVAGYTPRDTVLVVTRGALDNLDRDELQGVVAHEFSHIFYGDMRLNLTLLTLLAGITVVGELGMYLMDSAGKSALRQVEQSKETRHGFFIFPFVLGALIAAVGYIGVFLARLIKAALSRQREFLADAASVQFTRNPAGMAGALYKIEHYPRGTWLFNRYAEEISHFCFVPPLSGGFRLGAWLSGHPPTEQRVLAIDRLFYVKRRAAENQAEARPAAARPLAGGVATAVPAIDPALASLGVAAAVIGTLGNPTPAHLRYARALQSQMPLAVIDAAHKPESAREVVYALLLGKNRATLQAGGKLLARRAGKDTVLRADKLRKLLQDDLQRMRLPLLDLAMPGLKHLPEREREAFLENTRALIEADGKLSLFEYAVQVLLNKHLRPQSARPARRTLNSFDKALPELNLLLSLVVHTASSPEADKPALYERNMRAFTKHPPPRLPPAEYSVAGLENALNTLARLAPLLKRGLINACADCILADGRVVPAEMEILRIVAEALDCPLPPLPPPETGARAG